MATLASMGLDRHLEADVPSETGFAVYAVTTSPSGVVSCSCPRWRFQRKPAASRWCKHLRAMATDRR